MGDPGPLQLPDDGSCLEMYVEDVLHLTDKDGKPYAHIVLRAKESTLEFIFTCGQHDATTISYAKDSPVSAYPLAFELFKDILAHLNITVVKVTIAIHTGNTLYSTIILDNAGSEAHFDARTTDAISLALRSGAPIFVSNKLISKFGTDGGPTADEVNEMLKFYEKDLDPPPPLDEDSDDSI